MDPITRLGDALRRAGYDGETVAGRLGLDSMLRVKAADRPVYLRRLPREDDVLNTLIRMFLLHAPVRVEQLEAVLSPADISALVAPGVLEEQDGQVRSLLTILPDGGLLFASDRHERNGMRGDVVLGVTSAARTLAAMTVRKPVARALDVGTGCGVQALLAARHADHVVAVDINPRALWLTQLNCRLNGITNVECREGDLFEPVQEEAFDLVVSNPPFVLSPSVEYIYRDSRLGGDGISRAVVRGAAAVLRDGGVAAVMCNWATRRDEPSWLAPSKWVEGLGCDALVVHYDTLDPLAYAAAWNEDAAADPEAFGTVLDRWLAYDAEREIEAIGMGAVILRRRGDGEPWVIPVDLRHGPSGPAGDQVERIFSAQDVLLTATDDDLLDRRFRGLEGHRLEQALTFHDGAYAPADAVIVLDRGLGVRNTVSPLALHVLLRMDGERSLRELVAEAAEETGLDEGTVHRSTLASVRELYGLGLLEVHGAA